MYGGALCVSAAMTESGAAAWLTRSLFSEGFDSPALLLVSIGLAAALMTEFMSNSAVVAMLLPPTLAFAQSFGIDPRAAAMLIVLPSNFAFMFPMSTPATAVGWSLGFYRPREVATRGLVLHAFGFVAIAFVVWAWLPLFGLL
jgi:sodium-dependent dicarboxylate transporter 2/3/5